MPSLEAAEVLPHALAERLQRLEAVARLGGVQADALARAVVDGDEDVDLALAGGDGRGHVGAPHRRRARSVVIVPSWAFGPWAWPTRCGAWRSCSRISRRTRSLEVRMPWWRSRAQTLR